METSFDRSQTSGWTKAMRDANGYATTNPGAPNAGQTINPQTGVATGVSYSYNTQTTNGTTFSVTPGVYSDPPMSRMVLSLDISAMT